MRAMMERSMADIHKALKAQEFTSEEELNAFLQSRLSDPFVDADAGTEELTPLEQAQDLVWEAWETENRRERIRLAELALTLSADCADAYVLLGNEKASSAAEAMAMYEAGVRAGERAIGEAAFQQDAGHFWGLHETRPYMRARAALADCLGEMGKLDAAIEHYRGLLRLNPQDNQGIRYLLLRALIATDLDAEALELVRSYDEASANWLYNTALLVFKSAGEGPEADAALRAALDQNVHVPKYLLHLKALPRHVPDYISPGDESEAVAYVADDIGLWTATPGALDWLKRLRGK